MTRVALLADIHANYPALQAVAQEVAAWDPDMVYVLGDIINRGPRSQACLQFLLEKEHEKNWHMIRGNHEEYVLQINAADSPKSGPAYDILQFVHWTYKKLTPEELEQVSRLPYRIDRTLKTGHHIRMVHASMSGIRAGIYPSTPQEKLPDMIHPAPDMLCVGHTHHPLIRDVKESTIINAGSVGLPFDGDPRASYVQLSTSPNNIQIHIQRVAYDREQAKQDFYDTGFFEEGGPMVRIILTELETAQPLLSRWNRKYENKVRRGELSLQESVDLFLSGLEGPHSEWTGA